VYCVFLENCISIMDIKEIKNHSEVALKDWREKEKLALELLQIVGELRFDRSIELVFFRRDIYDTRPSQLIQYHDWSINYAEKPLKVAQTLSLAQEIFKLKGLGPAKIDLGQLCLKWEKHMDEYKDVSDFVRQHLDNMTGSNGQPIKPKDVVLYGFGRIGRLLARRIIATTGRGEQLRLKAIVLRPKMKDLYEETEKRLALLSSDSIHGNFGGQVNVSKDGKEVLINGNLVKMIYAAEPEDIDYTQYGIEDALVIDNTGVFRDREGLSRHLRPGVSHVMLTAPGKDMPNVVYGANQDSLDLEKDNVLCAASCTTNAIVPVIAVMDKHLGIEKGHIETIHAYTSDQNLLDNFHKKPRRGRGAPINMVLTSTGAASAVSKVFPHLKGLLTGNAVRVPTPDVSLAILNLHFKKTTTVEEVNDLLREASLHGPLVEQLEFSSSTEYVSNDAIGMTSTSVVDGPSTLVSQDGRCATIYAWYDNEYGYCCQVVRLAKHVAKVRRIAYY
jgi:glyceraldehyde 3-phosphate dehydrogenase